jgi:Domain of unknown function (DUF4279)
MTLQVDSNPGCPLSPARYVATRHIGSLPSIEKCSRCARSFALLGSVRIRQKAYFGIFSVTLTATDITGRLRVEPDVIGVRGSRSPQPPLPRHHSWRVTSEQPGLTVADHLDIVVNRLMPYADAIGSLVQEIV